MYRSEADRVATYWSKQTDISHTFYGFQPTQAYVRTRITGQSQQWEYEYLIDELMGNRLPVTRALSIMCGDGQNEIRLAKLGVFESCLALDISVGAIELARRAATEEGVTNVEFAIQDLNLDSVLPQHEFDLVIANGALHHALSLDGLLESVRKSMRPNALFLSSEYIGPDHYGRSFRQQQLIHALQVLIPLDLKQPAEHRRSRKKSWVLHLVSVASAHSRLAFYIVNRIRCWRLARKDPSEAIRSSQIVASVRATFPDVEVRYYGGSLLPYCVTPDLIDVLDLANPDHADLVRIMIDTERVSEASGDVAPSNAFFIAWNRPPANTEPYEVL